MPTLQVQDVTVIYPGKTAGDQVAAQAGRGAMIQSASDFLVTDVVILGIVVIGAIAYLFDLCMRWLEKVVVPWKGRM